MAKSAVVARNVTPDVMSSGPAMKRTIIGSMMQS